MNTMFYVAILISILSAVLGVYLIYRVISNDSGDDDNTPKEA